MDLKLQGKRVLVSGGSKGIGRAVTQAFGREGAAVMAWASARRTAEGTGEWRQCPKM